MTDFEILLREAFAPIEPPEDLEARLEERLSDLVQAAVDELEGWELAAMKDPRNWPTLPPTLTAVGVGGVAAVGLVLVRTQRRRHKRRESSESVLELAEQTVRDLARETNKLIDEGRRRL